MRSCSLLFLAWICKTESNTSIINLKWVLLFVWLEAVVIYTQKTQVPLQVVTTLSLWVQQRETPFGKEKSLPQTDSGRMFLSEEKQAKITIDFFLNYSKERIKPWLWGYLVLALDHFSPCERLLEDTGELLRPYLGLSDRKAFLWGVNNCSFRSAGPNIAHPLGCKTRATVFNKSN